MRFKSIPDDAIKFVEQNPYAIGGVVLAAVFGIYLYSHNATSPASAADTTYDPYSALSLGYSAPIAYPVSASVGGMSGSIGGTSTGIDPGAVTNKDLFDFEKLKQADDYDLALKTLEYNSNIAIANATLSMAGIQQSNFTAAAQLAASIVGSQATSLTGAIFGPGGNLLLAYGNAQTLSSTSKNSKTLAANATANQLGQSAFNNFLAQIGNMNVSQSGSSGSNGSTISGSAVGTVIGSISSVAASTIDATYSNNGTQQTIADAQPSSYSSNNASYGGGSNVINNISQL